VQDVLNGVEPDEAMPFQTCRTLMGATLNKHWFCATLHHLNLAYEVRNYLAVSIIKRRFIACDQCSHEFTVEIIGRRKSEKSVSLQLYSDQVSFELGIAGAQKHIFMLMRDARDFVPFMHDFEGFHHPFTEHSASRSPFSGAQSRSGFRTSAATSRHSSPP
jgi:hypothetical protein